MDSLGMSVTYQPPLDSGMTLATDMSTINLFDDFMDGANSTSLRVGKLGWQLGNFGSGAITILNTATYPNLGVLQMSTGAGASGGQSMGLLENGSIGVFGALGTYAGWSLTINFKVNQPGNTRIYIGFSDGAAITAMLNQIMLRYDTQKGDTKFQYLCNNNGSITLVNSNQTYANIYHTIKIYSDVAGEIQFQLDNLAPVMINTNVPTIALGAQLLLSNLTAVTSSVLIDTWQFRVTGLAR
jgi:hypothetical protein